MNTATYNPRTTAWAKIILAFVVCTLIRLLPPPFRAPNVEPLMTTLMPLGKVSGALAGALFAFVSMVSFDVITNHVGSWTVVTALTYAVLAFCAPFVLARIANARLGYVTYAIVATLVFDIITGVVMGPVLFHQPFMAALLGQIPFTLMHLAGNAAFAASLAPLLERWFALAPAEAPILHTRAHELHV